MTPPPEFSWQRRAIDRWPSCRLVARNFADISALIAPASAYLYRTRTNSKPSQGAVAAQPSGGNRDENRQGPRRCGSVCARAPCRPWRGRSTRRPSRMTPSCSALVSVSARGSPPQPTFRPNIPPHRERKPRRDTGPGGAGSGR